LAGGAGSDGPVADFCAQLKKLHAGCGLTQKSLARRLRMGEAQVSAILNGKITRPPSWELVEKIVIACHSGSEVDVFPAEQRARVLARWRSRHADLEEAFQRRRQRPRSVPGGVIADPAESGHEAGPAASPARVPVPRELPADVDAFTGRADELAELDRLLPAGQGHRAGREPTAVVISAVSGTAGVGKTALAVRWAHQAQDRFPDGQLYVNLRGYDPGQPMTAAWALAGFLRALGVPGQDIPAEENERAARYRSLLHGRQMLVVLDNASDVEQVRPLLPGTRTCAVVVTSRDALAGLVARDGARRLDLDLLPQADAVALLRALIGGRADADPQAAAVLAARCGRLPLALRVAAELAAARPAAPLAELAGELADQQRRLDLLDAGGDPRTAVRAVFSWSYRHLSADAALVFRSSGLHPGPDLDRYAAAALTGTTPEQAGRLLDVLARAHLIEPAQRGRYGMHDLLRDYATEQAVSEDPEPGRRAALTRLFDHYLGTAATAMDTVAPAERHLRPRIPPAATPAPPLPDPAAARAWLDAERATMVAVAAHTAACGWPGHATRLAATLHRYLDDGGHRAEAATIHAHARRATQLTGDRAAEATALTNLGFVDMRQDRYPQATDHHRQALALFRQIGDRAGQARALNNLGGIDWQQGRYQQAADRLQQSLAVFREIGDRTREANALGVLGAVDLRLGRYQQAADHYRQALAVFRQTGYRMGEALALTGLGDADLRLGRYQQAADHHRQALAMFREIGERPGEAGALNGLGEVLLATGQPGQARTQHAAALDLASPIGDRHQQARACCGLARACHAEGDLGQARRHWQQALTLYTDLGVPEADQVRAQLAALPDASG
jgi:tetratricopeptide (TPR) repeat protein/transcriptional regulator with XRE-family HTH domain